jgi:hypothetical protein
MGPDNGVTGSLTGRGVHGALCGDDIGSAWAGGDQREAQRQEQHQREDDSACFASPLHPMASVSFGRLGTASGQSAPVPAVKSADSFPSPACQGLASLRYTYSRSLSVSAIGSTCRHCSFVRPQRLGPSMYMARSKPRTGSRDLELR